MNSAEKISKLVSVIYFSWIFNFISLFFPTKPLLYLCMMANDWNLSDMPYLTSLSKIPSFKFLAFTISKFMNGIPFSSLPRGITHLFHYNLNHEVNLISTSLKLHSTQEHFPIVCYIYLLYFLYIWLPYLS